MSLDGNYRYVKMTALALLTYIFKAFGDKHTVSFKLLTLVGDK